MSTQATADLLFQIALTSGRYTHPLSLPRHHAQVYSQSGEDGIIAEIFSRIKTTNRFFVEIGIENGLQNNTRFLLEQGWRGIWIDGDLNAVASATNIFHSYIRSGHLTICHRMIDVTNSNKIFAEINMPDVIDFLAIDIDQNTSHVWRSLNIKARVACLEYNGQLPAASAVTTPQDPAQQWDGTNWYGASLKALEIIAASKNLHLVGCDLVGINAFFVDGTLTANRFMPPFTAETHHEPLRVPLVRTYGHPPSPVARSWVTQLK